MVGSFLPLQGQFVLAANFNSTYKYDLYPNRGTDSGVCLTVRPMVDFRQELFSPKDKDEYRVKKGDGVVSGEPNG